MASELFKLVGEVTIAGVEAVQKSLSAIDKNAALLDKSLNKLSNKISSVGMSLTKSITAPLLAVGGAVLLASEKTSKYAENLLNLKEVSGLSIDNLQVLKHITDQLGVSFEGVVNGIQQLTRKLPNIEKEGSAAYKAMNSLGISIYNSSGGLKTMNDLFPEVILKLQGIDDITKRNSIALQIFGRSISDLAPILGLSSEEMRKLTKEAYDLGLVVDEKGIIAADEFGDKIDNLKTEFQAFYRSLAIEIIPTLSELIPIIRNVLKPIIIGLVDNVKSLVEWFNNLTDTQKGLVIGLTSAVAITGPLLLAFGNILKTLKLLTPAISLFNTALLTNPITLTVVALASLGAAIWGTVDAYNKIIERHREWKVMTTDQVAINNFQEIVKKLTENILLYGKALNDPKKAQEILGKDMEAAIKIARDLGYVIEGDLVNKMNQLNKLSNALNGTFDWSTKTITMFEKGVENTTKTIETYNEGVKKTTKFQDEWSQKIISQQIEMTSNQDDQTKLRLQLNEMERNEAVRIAREKGEAIDQINIYYNNKSKEINADRTRQLLESYDTEKKILDDQKSGLSDITQTQTFELKRYVDNRNKSLAEILRLNEIEKNNAIQYATETGENVSEIKAEYLKKQTTAIYDSIQYEISMISNVVSQIYNLYAMAASNRISLIDQQLQKEISAINTSGMMEQNKQNAILKLQTEADKKKKIIQQEESKRQKRAAIFAAIINTAESVTKALTMGIPGIILAVILGALGAVQIGLIASQPLPMAKGKYIKGRRGGVVAEIGEGQDNELVFPLKRGVEEMVPILLDKLNSVSPRNIYEGATNNNQQIHYNFGTVIADESGLLELERLLYKHRIAENQRRGYL